MDAGNRDADGRFVKEISDLQQHEGASGINRERQEAPHCHMAYLDPEDETRLFVPDLGKGTVPAARDRMAGAGDVCLVQMQ